MRYIVALIFMIVGLSLSAQENLTYELLRSSTLPDTLTNSDTANFAFTNKFYRPGAVECYVNLDSLSGTPSGTAYLEVSYRSAGSTWYTADSGNLSDAAAALDDILVDASPGGVRYRVSIRTSGTMSVKITDCDCVWKADR